MSDSITLHVNGVERRVFAGPETPLLSVLREQLGLTGAKIGCAEGACGACTVLMGGRAVRACVTPAAAANAPVLTVEGLAGTEQLHPLQQAFLDAGAFQCGYCTPGMLMSVLALLAENPDPDEAAVVAALQGNICRCGMYARIVRAVRLAAGGGDAFAREAGSGKRNTVGGDAASDETVSRQPSAVRSFTTTDQRAGGPVAAARRTETGEPDAPAIGDWLHIAAGGEITVVTGKVEVGQHIRTSLAQAVAEELGVPAAAVRLVMGDTDRAPFDMGTFGSRTTPTMSLRLRQVAAAARELLRAEAAARLGVAPGELEVAGGQVTHRATGRALGYGELTGGRRMGQPYAHAEPRPPHAWTIAGREEPPANGRDIVTGAHRYTPDLALPGMLFGAVLRPPRQGARLVSLDTGAAEALPGVTVVRNGEFVGVAAPDRATARQAVAALRAEWAAPEPVAQAQLFEYLRTHPAPVEDPPLPPLPLHHEQGDMEAAREEAALALAQTYTVAYIAHAPLEPRAALAEWRDGRLTVCTGTQRPFGVRSELAAAFQIPEEAVRVIVPDTGSGYGGKHTGDAALEAARLALAAGAPVKLVWTREEEFSWAYVRPAGVIDATGLARADGTLAGWEFHNYGSGAAAIHTPYDAPAQRVAFHPALSPLRQGSYRALAATANHFARETLMDELAHALGADPLAYRLRTTRDERLRAVLEAAAAAFGWDTFERRPGRGRGIAGGTEKGSYLATCAEVAVDAASGAVRVVRVVQAFECGAIVNPAGVRSQVEGAIVQGLGGALFEQVTFEDGRITSHRFSSYRVPRFADMPAIEVILLDRRDLPPAGAGETPIVGVAPAVGNAIFDATGVRQRALPLAPQGVVR